MAVDMNGTMDMEVETNGVAATSAAETFLKQMQALQLEMRELRAFSERQQDSITSLIALSQKQSGIIEQQNALIQNLALNSSDPMVGGALARS